MVNRPTQLLVIADDLTGANDVGAQFAKKGVRSFVTTDLAADLPKLFGEFQVVVVDSESRHLTSEEAASRIFSLVTRARQAGIEYFYKKTDSTLRGNLGAELEAMLRASGKPTLCFLPALPPLGRTTREGIQYVRGRPLHETEFARDPRNPMQESRVAEVLAKQSRAAMTVVNLERFASFAHSTPPHGMVIFDSETEDDMRNVGGILKQTGCLNVLAATAGFAEHLPDFLEFHRTEPPNPDYRRPMLVVNGSLNPVSLQQIVHAEQFGFVSFKLSPEILAVPDGAESPLADAIVRDAAETSTRKHDLALWSVRHRDELGPYEELAAKNRFQLHEVVARNTGRIVGSILSRARTTLLVVFGGDTLMAIARELQWSGFLPCGELLPGITVSEIPEKDPLVLISKSGGFGAENVLTEIRELLEKKARC